jgi:hypothetical protein
MAESSALYVERTDQSDHHPEGATLPILGEVRLGCRVLDRAEPIEPPEVVNAVHVENPTAIGLGAAPKAICKSAHVVSDKPVVARYAGNFVCVVQSRAAALD